MPSFFLCKVGKSARFVKCEGKERKAAKGKKRTYKKHLDVRLDGMDRAKQQVCVGAPGGPQPVKVIAINDIGGKGGWEKGVVQ